jgi:hypothetical protein
VNGRADLQLADVDADRLGHVVGRALDLQGVHRPVEDAAGDAGGRAAQLDAHRQGDALTGGDAAEIRVARPLKYFSLFLSGRAANDHEEGGRRLRSPTVAPAGGLPADLRPAAR